MSSLILYSYFRSSAAYRVRIALNLKGLSYKTHHVHLVRNGGEQYNSDYCTINPQQLVPSLVTEDRTVIPQSLAIIEYLEETYPQAPLLSGDAKQRALIRAFALAISCDMHPLNNLRVLNYLKHEFDVNEAQKSTWYHHWIKQGFTALEQQISNGGNKQFCFGDAPSLADICLIPQMYNAQRFHCDLSQYPTLRTIYNHCMEIDAFYKAAPEAQADYEES